MKRGKDNQLLRVTFGLASIMSFFMTLSVFAQVWTVYDKSDITRVPQMITWASYSDLICSGVVGIETPPNDWWTPWLGGWSTTNILNIALYSWQNANFYTTFQGKQSSNVIFIMNNPPWATTSGQLAALTNTGRINQTSKLFIYNPYGSMWSNAWPASPNTWIPSFLYTSSVKPDFDVLSPSTPPVIIPWSNAAGSLPRFYSLTGRAELQGQIVHNIWRWQPLTWWTQSRSDTNTLPYWFLQYPDFNDTDYVGYSSLLFTSWGSAYDPAFPYWNSPSSYHYARYRNNGPVTTGQDITQDREFLCNNIYVASCGDWFVDDPTGQYTALANWYNWIVTTDRWLVNWTFGTWFQEVCDPGNVWLGIPAAWINPNTEQCAADCQSKIPLPFCNTTSPTTPTITTNPFTTNNPSQAWDSAHITFSCNTANNPNWIIAVYSWNVLIVTGALPAWNGSVTILSWNTTVGQVFTVECQNSAGVMLSYAQWSSPCNNSVTVVADWLPQCIAALALSWVWVVQPTFINPSDEALYVCIFGNYDPVIPPDGMTIQGPGFWPNVVPVITWLFDGGPAIWMFSSWLQTTPAPWQYTLNCVWSWAACNFSYFVVDPTIEKYQNIEANVNAVAPTYWITWTQDGSPQFMSLNGANRIYYRLELNDFGPFTGFVSDVMPTTWVTVCKLDYARTSPWIFEQTAYSGTYAPWVQPLWVLPYQWVNANYRIVYFCDYIQWNQPFQLYNSGYAWINNPFSWWSIFNGYDYVNVLNSNTVAAEYLPIPSLTAVKYQSTGWNIADTAWLTILNQQWSLFTGSMDITSSPRIYYRLNTVNNWVTLDNLQINDNLPFNNCVIENVDTIHSWAQTVYGWFPAPITNPLWTWSTVYNWTYINIIISCDVPMMSGTYINQFTASGSVAWTPWQQISNSVSSIRWIDRLFIDKTQNNYTANSWGVFSGGAYTFITWDIFVFHLDYGNTGSGTMTGVTVVDTFPTWFTLLASSVTSWMTCNPTHNLPTPLPNVQNCTWNIWSLAANATGQIIITGSMQLWWSGYFYNTGQIFASWILFGESVVQQIPLGFPQYPLLEITKTQTSALNSWLNSNCSPLPCGTYTTWQITVANNYFMSYRILLSNIGSGSASWVNINDVLPVWFVPTYITGNLWTIAANCNQSGPVSWQFTINCNLTQILPWSWTIMIQIDWYVTTDVTNIYASWSNNIQSYSNTATVITSPFVGQSCLIHGDCPSNTVVAIVTWSAQLEILKYFNQPTANPWDIVVFTIQYRNFGSIAASWMYIADIMPQWLTYVSHLPNPPVYTSNQWFFGTLAPSANYSYLYVTARVNTGFQWTSIVNTWTICAANVAWCPVATGLLIINQTTGFNIVKTAQYSGQNITSITSWQTYTYLLDFVNNGSTTLTTYQVTDFLPSTAIYNVWSARAKVNWSTLQVANPVISAGLLRWSCTNWASSQLPTPCSLPAWATWQVLFNVTVN